MRFNGKKSEFGFSIVELLVSMLISATLVAGAISLFVNNSRASSDVLKITRINQEMRTVLDLITADVRRAGFWGNATTSIGQNNPFGITDVVQSPGCITYTYDDANANGTLQSPAETHGFRLNDTSGAIEIRSNAAACTDTTNWNLLTDNSMIKVTKLDFTRKTNCTNITNKTNSVCTVGDANYTAPASGDILVSVNSLTINLDAELASAPEITVSLVDHVIVRNDIVSVAP